MATFYPDRLGGVVAETTDQTALDIKIVPFGVIEVDCDISVSNGVDSLINEGLLNVAEYYEVKKSSCVETAKSKDFADSQTGVRLYEASAVRFPKRLRTLPSGEVITGTSREEIFDWCEKNQVTRSFTKAGLAFARAFPLLDEKRGVTLLEIAGIPRVVESTTINYVTTPEHHLSLYLYLAKTQLHIGVVWQWAKYALWGEDWWFLVLKELPVDIRSILRHLAHLPS